MTARQSASSVFPHPTVEDGILGEAGDVSGGVAPSSCVVGQRRQLQDVEAVSYTHLDLYKRQAYIYVNGGSGWPTTPTVTLADPAATAQDLFGSSVAVSGDTAMVGAPKDISPYTGTAVSYTHLDVYKRQVVVGRDEHQASCRRQLPDQDQNALYLNVVKMCCGFVGQHQGRVVNEGSGDGYALLLATRHLSWSVTRAIDL